MVLLYVLLQHLDAWALNLRFEQGRDVQVPHCTELSKCWVVVNKPTLSCDLRENNSAPLDHLEVLQSLSKSMNVLFSFSFLRSKDATSNKGIATNGAIGRYEGGAPGLTTSNKKLFMVVTPEEMPNRAQRRNAFHLQNC